MSPRVAVLVVLVLVVALASGGYAVAAWRQHRATVRDAPPVASTDMDEVLSQPHVVFRSTAPGSEYGLVAAVPLDDPDGPRAFTDIPCDRVDVSGDQASCLRTVRGIATRFEAELFDARWQQEDSWPLPGIPSRTRLSTDGAYVATTSFVTGHSYASVGFSTETVIRRTDGTEDVGTGNIEDYLLIVDGAPFEAVDRNMWGVTFVDDDTFYATAASQSAGKTWLVRGSMSARILTAVQEDAECPSISPDGTHVAYKKVVDHRSGQSVWALATLDLTSGEETLIPSTEGLDDQAEWLDDDTLLYGLPHEGEAGTTDVWSVDTRADATPELFIPGAWSPAVVR